MPSYKPTVAMRMLDVIQWLGPLDTDGIPTCLVCGGSKADPGSTGLMGHSALCLFSTEAERPRTNTPPTPKLPPFKAHATFERTRHTMFPQPAYGKIAQLRKAAGMTQARLAEAIGKNQNYVARVERGYDNGKGVACTTNMAELIAAALDTTVEELQAP